MFEPVTLVKVRQQTTVTVPAGGWVVIGSPDEPLAAQIARRADLIKNGNVNDQFERLLIGRLNDTHTPTRFVTKAEKAAHDQERAAVEKNLTNSHAEAKQREKDRQAAAEKLAREEHEAQVRALNRQNDSIRNRDAQAAPVPVVKLEIKPENSSAGSNNETLLNEFTIEQLQALNHGELLALATDLFTAGRLPEKVTGKKSDLIAAILTATPKPPEPVS